MTTLTLEQFINQVKTFGTEKSDSLMNLKYRWREESKYEDFNDYKALLVRMAQKYNITPTKITKAFSIHFEYKNVGEAIIKVKSDSVELVVKRRQK